MRNRLKLLTGLAILACTTCAHAQDGDGVCRVLPGGAGSHSGADWDNAMELQQALTTSGCTEVWVRYGVYVPGNAATDSFVIPPGVEVYGGFSRFEISRTARNPWRRTILSGDIGLDDVNLDRNSIADTGDDIRGSNSHHVVTFAAVTGGPDTRVLDGFIITAGDAPIGERSGGGVHIELDGNGQLATPAIRHVVFSGNRAAVSGGALSIAAVNGADASPSLDNVAFVGNHAAFGGAVAISTRDGGVANPVLRKVAFVHNQATSYGGGIYTSTYSGGQAAPTLTNVTFADNHAGGGSGSALYSFGGSGQLTHVTVLAPDGDATALGYSQAGGAMTPSLRNVIVWRRHGHAALIDGGAGVDLGIAHAIVKGGCPADATCTDVSELDPQLGELLHDGGLWSLIPAPDSPALDAASALDCPASDQRGAARVGSPCDLGAIERLAACHVDADAAPAGDGSSWASAYRDLQLALHDPKCIETWVAEGVYLPVQPVNPGSIGSGERNERFDIAPGSRLYGGFAGHESVREQRDPQAHPTILSGDLAGDDDTNNADGNFIDEQYQDIVPPNTRSVVWLAGTSSKPITASTVLDGFIITGGSAANFDGGGLHCDAWFGGTCSPTLAQLLVSGNMAAESGGGLAVSATGTGQANPSLSQVTFRGNSANEGGALSIEIMDTAASSPRMTAVTFIDNVAIQSGGAINVYTRDSATSRLLVTNASLRGNLANQGGALACQASNASHCKLIMTHATLSDNDANQGTAMYGDESGSASITVQVANSIVWPATSSTPPIAVPGGTTVANSIVRGGCPGNANCSGVITQDPLLGPLGDHGGFTPTMPPAAGSPVIDAGNDAACPGHDQRGAARPQGWACDLGAVELRTAIELRALGTDFQHALGGDAFAYPLVAQALDGHGLGVAGLVPTVVVPGSGASAICTASPTSASGITQVHCSANSVVGSYTVTLSVIGASDLALSRTFHLSNEPNDRIFGSGFAGRSMPTGDTP